MVIDRRGRRSSEVGNSWNDEVSGVSGRGRRCGGEAEEAEERGENGAVVRRRLPEAVLVVLECLLQGCEDGASELGFCIRFGEVVERLGDVLDGVARVACDDGLGQMLAWDRCIWGAMG